MGIAKKVTGGGNYAALIGGAFSEFHAIYCEVKAAGADELITRIAVSYADNDHGTELLCGRLLVLKEQMPAPDELLDPAGIDTGSAAPSLNLAFDQFITRKGLVDCLQAGEAIRVPKGATYYIYLTSAYSPSEGPFPADPGEKRAKLLVRTQTAPAGKPYRVETY